MGDDIAPLPVGRNCDFAAISTHVILIFRHIRRIILKEVVPRIPHIHIYGIAVAIQLPVAGHWNLGPRSIVEVGSVEIHRTLIGIGHKLEFPHTIEVDTLLTYRGERRAHRQAVDFVDFLALPFMESLCASAQSSSHCQD